MGIFVCCCCCCCFMWCNVHVSRTTWNMFMKLREISLIRRASGVECECISSRVYEDRHYFFVVVVAVDYIKPSIDWLRPMHMDLYRMHTYVNGNVLIKTVFHTHFWSDREIPVASTIAHKIYIEKYERSFEIGRYRCNTQLCTWKHIIIFLLASRLYFLRSYVMW